MRYISTRGGSEPVDFVGAALAGLAPDGGLYIPEVYPQLPASDRPVTYVELATQVMSAFAGDAIPQRVMRGLVEQAYAGFAHHSVAPLVQIGPGRWMMELFHGPTLAFKDVAMRMIARIYDYLLTERGERMTILCATSGDTGGAAAAAFAGARSVQVVILHPNNRVSSEQRRFMTTTGASNIHNLALEGDFDGAQAILKELLADAQLKQRTGLAAVNSVNWIRIAAQSVYFAQAQQALGRDRDLRFVVPTGNFGDAFSGFVAGQCGLVRNYNCVAAVNENDALVNLLAGQAAPLRATKATLSPAMDIQVPSNFERLLFEALDRDGIKTAQVLAGLADRKAEAAPASLSDAIRGLGVSAERVSDEETLEEIRRSNDELGQMVCPHTAVGLAAARRLAEDGRPVVVLSTAHPAKFPEAMTQAFGAPCPMPARVETSGDLKELFEVGPMEAGFVRSHLETIARSAL